MLGRHAYLVPSSVGLAEFIAAQTPYPGDPWELAYDLNENKLVPQRVLNNMLETHATSVSTHVRALRTEFESLTVSQRSIRASFDRGVAKMSRQTINLQTFGRDPYQNLQTLLGNFDHQISIDRSVIIHTFELQLIEGQLKEIAVSSPSWM